MGPDGSSAHLERVNIFTPNKIKPGIGSFSRVEPRSGCGVHPLDLAFLTYADNQNQQVC